MTVAVLLAVVVVVVVVAWLSGSKRRLFSRMAEHVTTIQVGVYRKLALEYCAQHGEERGKLLAAAVGNRLFAKRARHEPEILELAERLTREVVQSDEEVRYAALMSLRTLMTIKAKAGNTEAMQQIMDTVQWMKQFWELPPDAPDPQLMEQLAAAFVAKYS